MVNARFQHTVLRVQVCIALVCYRCVLHFCVAGVYCTCVLQVCIALVCCRCILHLYVASMYCTSVLQVCIALVCCRYVLHLCVVGMYCTCVLCVWANMFCKGAGRTSVRRQADASQCSCSFPGACQTAGAQLNSEPNKTCFSRRSNGKNKVPKVPREKYTWQRGSIFFFVLSYLRIYRNAFCPLTHKRHFKMHDK